MSPLSPGRWHEVCSLDIEHIRNGKGKRGGNKTFKYTKWTHLKKISSSPELLIFGEETITRV